MKDYDASNKIYNMKIVLMLVKKLKININLSN